MCTSSATRLGIDGVDSTANGSGDSPLRAAHVFRVAAVLLRGLPHGRSRLSLQQGVEGNQKKKWSREMPSRPAVRRVSSPPRPRQVKRARCELVDPRENDDRQSSTQQCPPTLRATGLFPIKRTAFAASLSLRRVFPENGEESSFVSRDSRSMS